MIAILCLREQLQHLDHWHIANLATKKVITGITRLNRIFCRIGVGATGFMMTCICLVSRGLGDYRSLNKYMFTENTWHAHSLYED